MNNDKFVSKKGEMHLIGNEDMDCKNCIFAYKDNSIECIMYKQKPISILDGNHCEKKAVSVEEAKRKKIQL